ncbi:MAG: type III pantothenate kinase [Bacteroidetes bacterium]|jgi:type III pantothenate kinase|nr:type III pantothenate kinase [Bacteroidota bacterium]MCB0603367.1 type III pantothenate kinase [Saprospiraceae bacterium]HMT78350.1 type III pantothenate kinase [Saprospiraceae bacterium]HQU95261.1 type III pantothenate kinase [Saprospiraceae bacterium]HQW95015.1 type III pantothenate kinase [Saprospiraceae bacterium]
MILTIDAGNSRVKYGLYEDDTLMKVIIRDSLVSQDIENICIEYNIQRSILCASRNLTPENLAYLHARRTLIVDENTQIPIKNKYRTPKTLGKDRLAGAVGAHFSFPFAHNLYIDIGTAMTINFINNKGEFLGGNISPGLQMRLKALNLYTDQLPKPDLDDQLSLYGSDTEQALKNGAIHGVIAEIEYYKRKFSELYSPLKIILTGGNSIPITHFLNESYVIKPDLVLEGLNEILKIND